MAKTRTVVEPLTESEVGFYNKRPKEWASFGFDQVRHHDTLYYTYFYTYIYAYLNVYLNVHKYTYWNVPCIYVLVPSLTLTQASSTNVGRLSKKGTSP